MYICIEIKVVATFSVRANQIFFYYPTKPKSESLRGVMYKAIDWGSVVSEFELQFSYKVHFRTNKFGKVTDLLYSPYYGLNSITAFLLAGWLWHYITDKDWYAFKQRNQRGHTVINLMEAWKEGTANTVQILKLFAFQLVLMSLGNVWI